MFDMKSIGQIIARRRKEMNLTQVELADQLLVSYQAVSGWERGLSMPDVSNLPKLAEVLDISLDELLGQKEAQLVEKIQKEELLEEEELVELAPFIKPDDFEEQVKDRTFSKHSLVMLAPFLSADKLYELICEQEIKGKHLVKLAPFLESHHLEALLLKDGTEVDSMRLIALAPFLNAKSLGVIAQRNDLSASSLIALAPFLSAEDLGGLVREKMKSGTFNKGLLMGLAPFLREEDLLESIQKPGQPQDKDDVEIIEEETLKEEVSKLEGMLEKLKRKLR